MFSFKNFQHLHEEFQFNQELKYEKGKKKN